MQEKQKVTLYIPQNLHKQLKVKAAVETETMSAIVERAIAFYLRHPEVIEETEASNYGKTYQVHICPECEATMVMKDGQLVSLKSQPSVITEEFPVQIPTEVEELVVCR
jgi:hypothetical protein